MKPTNKRTTPHKTAGIDLTRPWHNEPDITQGAFGDIPWRIQRMPEMGHLNGYIAIPKGHPWHGVDFDTLEDVQVHGMDVSASGSTYKDLNYLKNEVELLATQAASASQPKTAENFDV